MPESQLAPHQWAHLLATATNERITGLLVQAIVDGALPTTPEQAEEAKRAHRASMATALALEATLVHTARLLEAAGVDYRVLKGPAVAHLDYPDPALRSFGDVDLLLRASQFDEAIEALAAVRLQRKFPEPRSGFDRRFGKGSCMVSPDGDEIDLHRTLAMGPYGLALRLDDLWQRCSTFHLAGRPFPALAPEERFLHACFHAVLGDNASRLASLRDVAQMHLARPLDVELTRRLSAAWGSDAVVAEAVRLAGDILGVASDGPLTRWAAGYSPTRRDRQFLAVYMGVTPHYAAMSFAAIRAIPRIRDKAAFVFMLAAPRRRYLDERGEQTARRWRRALTEIRQARRSG
ncbi:MAG: nucleotidyltransferase family protein [Actinobacteria bacterium]|nr:nucleotidyltransferase family protein [Actinomycetota bacterium]